MLSHYDQLIERLERKEYAKIVEPLKALISEIDFDKIIYFLLKNPILKTIGPGGAYRFDKRQTDLPRTITILRSDEGEFGCILETKRKLAVGRNWNLPIIGGSYKRGKPAWEISGALNDRETECFNLVAQYENLEDRLEIENEANFSRRFASDYIHKNKQGLFFKNPKYRQGSKDQHPYKISLYSLKAEDNFFDYLKRVQTKLPPAIKSKMFSQLLQAVKVLHDEAFVHQDLKLENILIYQDGNLALTDFGLYGTHEGNEAAMTTAGYHSPEMAYFYSDKYTSQHAYYEKNACHSSLANQYMQAYKNDRVERTQFGSPHKANDMWALGIIFFQMLYGYDRYPDLAFDEARIKAHPLLAGLLTPWWEDRLTIEQAIDIHEKSKTLKEEEKQEKPTIKRRRIR